MNDRAQPTSSGSMTSRSGTLYGSSISCNRCRKPLSTTVFVCSCDCAFCEECTYAHFNESSRCPSCNKSLSSNDFMELVVADPSSATEETLKNTFQSIFTKFNPNSNSLSHQEMCSRLLKSFDNGRRAIRFLLKQMVVDGNSRGQQSSTVTREMEQLKREHTALKQASSSQRIKLEQAIADLQHKVQALNGTVQEYQEKLVEKDTRISQFRQLYATEGQVRVPNASTIHGSGGRKPRSAGSGGATYNEINNNYRPVVSSSSAATPPPLQGFVEQKRAREQAEAQAWANMTRSRVMTGMAPTDASRSRVIAQSGSGGNASGMIYDQRDRGDIDSVITPIQVPQLQSSSHRVDTKNINPYNGSRSGNATVLPGSNPGQRDYSANSGNIFSSRSGGHNRLSSNSYENNPNKRGRVSTSPSGQIQQSHHFGYSRKW